MTAYPRITLGLACYNAADTIVRAINSALSQDWPDIELLVVDDASTDGSVSRIQEAIVSSAKARLIRHHENRGVAAARNTILAHSSGEFVVFLDDDDESAPGRSRDQYETLTQYEQSAHTRLVACYASGRRRYPNGYEIKIQAIGSYSEIPKGSAVADFLLFGAQRPGVFYGGGTPACALMARVATLVGLGGFDEQLRRVEDADLAVRLALAGGHFVGSRRCTYLQHATTGSDKTPAKNLEAELRLVEKHETYLKSQGRYRYAQMWFEIRCYHFSGQRGRFLATLAELLARHPLLATQHLLRSAPARWIHERNMARQQRP